MNISDLWSQTALPVVVTMSIYATFEFLQIIASKEARSNLTQWLKNTNPQSARALPDQTMGIFHLIFGPRHLSWFCFRRSMYLTVLAIVLVILVQFNVLWPRVRELVGAAAADEYNGRKYLIMEGGWLSLCVFFDYVNLLKTRALLGYLRQRRRLMWWWLPPLVSVDLAASTLLFIATTLSSLIAAGILVDGAPRPGYFDPDWGKLLWVLKMFFLSMVSGNGSSDIRALYLVSLVPAAWLWLYVIATLTARLLVRSDRLLRLLRKFLNINDTPFRSVGVVISALAFILCAAGVWIASIVTTVTAPPS